MNARRLDGHLRFLLEVDRLKTVLRRTRLVDASRHENSAEHSWHLALCAMVLAEHAPEGTDLGRVVRMVLVHDIVEVDAGDAFCYDADAMAAGRGGGGGIHRRGVDPGGPGLTAGELRSRIPIIKEGE